LQRFCAAPKCRTASKQASQRRWLRKPENQAYFRGEQHVNRVQAWREKHPDYGQKPLITGQPLQEMIMAQPIDSDQEISGLALQDVIRLQVHETPDEIGIWATESLQDPM
jgi:hypothetical protein